MYKLAKHISIIFLLAGICSTAFGQTVRPMFRRPPNLQQRIIRQQAAPGLNRIEQVREEYVGRRLDLTAEQGQKFWPVYRRYWAAIKEIRRKKRLNNSNNQANGTEQINRELYYESELVNTRKYYTDEFLKILPPDKVSLIFKSEREFQDELIRQLSERNGSLKNNP